MSTPEPYQPPSDLKTRLKEAYDAIAPQYNAWTESHSPLRLAYLDKLLALLLPPGQDPARPLSVLELGSGAGIPVAQKLLASAPGLVLTANDISSAQVALARANLRAEAERGRVTWAEGDMTALAFPDASLDAVCAFFSLIHLPREEQVLMLSRVARWLRPGGYLLANFAAEEIPGVVMERWLSQEKGWMFWSGWGAEGSLGKVREAGLEVVLGRVEEDDVDANFLWVIARKPTLS